MPIIENLKFLKIPADSTCLWRYMDIPSYIHLLTSSSLTFVRANLFEDKFEGRLPEKVEKILKARRFKIKNFGLNKIEKIKGNSTYLNCWCMKNHQMVHMWKIYSKENGIAIESDYKMLKKSILSMEQIFATEISYIDRKEDTFNYNHNMEFLAIPYTLKSKEYVSEYEFRLIVYFPKQIQNKIANLKTKKNESMKVYSETPVIKCEVNLNELISKIHISPYAPKWYKEFIVDITEKYGLDVPIEQAEL